jgi:hypothetical protein
MKLIHSSITVSLSWGEKAESYKVIVQLCVTYTTELFVEVALDWSAHHTKPAVLIGLI